MRLASFRTAQGASYGAVTSQGIVDLGRRLGSRYTDVGTLQKRTGLEEERKAPASPADYKESEVTGLPVIPNPGKIVCVGLNYEEHRQETGRDKTEQPALFLRLAESQVGQKQPILRPREWKNLDYEAEIALVIGRAGRRISQKDSWNYVAGYSCYNDGSVRDWQRHTIQWTAGKNFASTGGFGPWMVTADEIPAGTLLTLSCRLDGERLQDATTRQMIFQVPERIQ